MYNTYKWEFHSPFHVIRYAPIVEKKNSFCSSSNEKAVKPFASEINTL